MLGAGMAAQYSARSVSAAAQNFSVDPETEFENCDKLAHSRDHRRERGTEFRRPFVLLERRE
jgi:hypothetical protein